MDDPKPPGKRGPKPKPHIEPQISKRFCDAIALGNTYNGACIIAGISKSKFYDWRKKDSDFHDAVQEAEGRALLYATGNLAKMVRNENLDAIKFFLERRYPEDWGRTVHDQRNYDMGTLSDADLEAIARGESPGRTGAA